MICCRCIYLLKSIQLILTIFQHIITFDEISKLTYTHMYNLAARCVSTFGCTIAQKCWWTEWKEKTNRKTKTLADWSCVVLVDVYIPVCCCNERLFNFVWLFSVRILEYRENTMIGRGQPKVLNELKTKKKFSKSMRCWK